jgi:hypothetical protein
MIQRITEELYFDDGSRRYHKAPGEPEKVIGEAGKWYVFELCCKREQMGEIPVDQCWMELVSVYGQRNRTARNREVIIAYFWALCMKNLTVLEDDVQESYILARLLPHVRSHGSRRVLADAILTDPNRVGINKRDLIKQLDTDLARHHYKEMELGEFRDATAKVLEMPIYDQDVWNEYHKYADEILGEGRQALQRHGTDGIAVPLERWQQWMKSVGRHRGREDEKRALDILSYECRAALHRCYSAVWCDLLLHLADKYSMSEESIRFHRLWHLDQCQKSNSPEAYFHLFHGHIFALHPGSGLFMQTKTGCELIGQWLANPESRPAFQRLLHGLCLAMGDYARRSDLASTLRTKDAAFVTGYNLEEEEASQVKKSKHRRLPGVRDDFDN